MKGVFRRREGLKIAAAVPLAPASLGPIVRLASDVAAPPFCQVYLSL